MNAIRYGLPLFLVVVALPAQGLVEPYGFPGRYGQQVGAIQRNSTLRQDDSVRVATGRTLFVRFLADTNRTITGFDLVLDLPVGKHDVAVTGLYDADNNDLPAHLLSTGRIGIAGVSRWCRTSFAPYRIQTGKLYFLAVDLSVDAVNVGCTTHGAATDVAYVARPFGGAMGAVKFAKILYRVNADGTAPHIESLTPPTAKTTWTVRCNGVPPGRLAVLTLGAVPTQVDLAPAFPGNFLWTTLDCFPAWVGVGSANGQVTTGFYVWPDPGFVYCAQWIVETPGVAGGLTTSDAQKLTVR